MACRVRGLLSAQKTPPLTFVIPIIRPRQFGLAVGSRCCARRPIVRSIEASRNTPVARHNFLHVNSSGWFGVPHALPLVVDKRASPDTHAD